MLKTLIIAVLLGLTSARPSTESGQEMKIVEPKSLMAINEAPPIMKANVITKMDEMPDLSHPMEIPMRHKRASGSSSMDSTGTSGTALPSALVTPLSAESGQEMKIMEPKSLMAINEAPPIMKANVITKMDEMPDLSHPMEIPMRHKRASGSSSMDSTGTSGTALPSALVTPLKAVVTLLVDTVITLVESILTLVSDILNPILTLLTGLLDPILEPLRPVLDPILLPLNGLLTSLLKALRVSLNLSGLLTGNVTSPASTSILMASRMTPELDNDPSMISEPSLAKPADSEERRRRAIASYPPSTSVAKLRGKRQSPGTGIGSGINSIIALPLTLVKNILEAIKSFIVFPLESILAPLFSMLHLPTDLISEPLDLVESILSNVESVLSKIIVDIAGPIENLPQELMSMLSSMLVMPDALAERVQSAAVRQTRSAASAESEGPLNVVLSILSGPLKTLFSYLPTLLGYFNVSYSTLQEAAQVLFSKAAKRFFAMVYDQLKNFILPGVDDLLQSIVGSEYIPDYMNTAISQFHTVYQLLKMVGYLRPS